MCVCLCVMKDKQTSVSLQYHCLLEVKTFAEFQTVANCFECDVHFLRRKVLFMSALACELKSVFTVGKCDLCWGRREEEEKKVERGRKRTKRWDSSSGQVNLGIFGNARTLRGRVILAAASGFCSVCADAGR